MSIPEWKWAWGQGYSDDQTRESFDILASPLNMARVASAVVNQGTMPVTQYLMPDNKYEQSLRQVDTVRLLEPGQAAILKEYMLAEAANQYTRQNHSVSLPSYVGGKTGTPERTRLLKKGGKATINDGWYMFFVEGDDTHHPIAVAVRMERGVGSGHAVRLAGNKLLDILRRHGYTR